MINRWIGELKPAGLPTRPVELARKARHRVREVRGGSVERLFTLQADALERVEEALHKAPENVPVLSSLADAAERLVARTRVSVTAVSVDGYDDLNAKQVREKLRDLGHLDLVKLRRYETSNKGRKSVIGEIEKEIGRRFKLAEPPAPIAAAEPTATPV